MYDRYSCPARRCVRISQLVRRRPSHRYQRLRKTASNRLERSAETIEKNIKTPVFPPFSTVSLRHQDTNTDASGKGKTNQLFQASSDIELHRVVIVTPSGQTWELQRVTSYTVLTRVPVCRTDARCVMISRALTADFTSNPLACVDSVSLPSR